MSETHVQRSFYYLLPLSFDFSFVPYSSPFHSPVLSVLFLFNSSPPILPIPSFSRRLSVALLWKANSSRCIFPFFLSQHGAHESASNRSVFSRLLLCHFTKERKWFFVNVNVVCKTLVDLEESKRTATLTIWARFNQWHEGSSLPLLPREETSCLKLLLNMNPFHVVALRSSSFL